MAVSELGQRSRDEIPVLVGGNIACSNRARHTQGIINPKFDILGILCDSMPEFECPHPGCEESNKTFETEERMKIHHSLAHNESLAKDETNCENCGKTFTYYPSKKEGRLCNSCVKDDSVDMYEFIQNEVVGETRECPNCGTVNTVTPYEAEKNDRTFCNSECYKEYRANNTNTVEISCEFCGDTKNIEKHRFEKTDDNFCSLECRIEDMKKETIKVVCSNCGKEEKRRPSAVRESSDRYYCSPKCQREDLFESDGGKTEIECDNCGEVSDRWVCKIKQNNHTFCGEECRYDFFSTDDLEYNNYGRNFYKARRKVRERDNYSCQICGKDKSDLGVHPSAHHITPVSWFVENGYEKHKANYRENLVLLCKGHHRKVEHEIIDLKENISDELAEELELSNPDKSNFTND